MISLNCSKLLKFMVCVACVDDAAAFAPKTATGNWNRKLKLNFWRIAESTVPTPRTTLPMMGLSAMADKDEREGFKATTALTEDLRSKMIEINRKQDKLLEGYISDLVEPDRYREERNKLTSEKKT